MKEALLVLAAFLLVCATVWADSTAIVNIRVEVLEAGGAVPPTQPPPSGLPGGGGGGGGIPPENVEIIEVRALDTNVHNPAIINVLVKNRGTQSAQVKVRLRIQKGENTLFDFNEQRNTIPAKATSLFVFDSWVPTQAGEYSVIAEVYSSRTNQLLATRVGSLTVSGVFRFDIQIVAWRKITQAGGDQNFLVELENKGETFDDLLLSYWIENEEGRKISAESFTLAVSPGEKKLIQLALEIPVRAPEGKYFLNAEIRFRENHAESRVEFQVVPKEEYRNQVLDELEERLREIAQEISQKKSFGFETSGVEKKLEGLAGRLENFRKKHPSLSDKEFDLEADQIRADAFRLSLEVRLLTTRIFLVYLFGFLVLAILLLLVLLLRRRRKKAKPEHKLVHKRPIAH